MSSAENLQSLLRNTFAEAIEVRPVPMGLAIRSPFTGGDGDPLTFYVRETGDGYQLEDDGDYLAHLVASGIDIEKGQRRILLDSVLSSSGASWDPETFTIRSASTNDLGSSSISFLSALLRIRDLEALTKEAVRSTFKDDVIAVLAETLGEQFTFERSAPVSSRLEDYPADVVLTPRRSYGRRVGVFLVNNPTPFLEAELLHSEIEKEGLEMQAAATALIEDFTKISMVGARRYQRAVNRGLSTAFFRGDERAALHAIARVSFAQPAGSA